MTQAAAALIFFLSTCSAFAAETAWDVLQGFGYTGVWAASCSHPSTPSNFRTILSKDINGLARREIERGAGFPIALSFVDSAQMISPSMLKIRVRNADPNWGVANNLTHEALLIKEDDLQTKEIFRIRFLESIRSDGMVVVKNGILIARGKPSFWVYKCRSAMS